MTSKIEVLDGDLAELDLGLSQQNLEEIYARVNVIISNGANTSWTSELQESVISNTRGPLELLKIAKKCQKLDHFIHISTFGVERCAGEKLQEKVYNVIDDPETKYKAILDNPEKA